MFVEFGLGWHVGRVPTCALASSYVTTVVAILNLLVIFSCFGVFTFLSSLSYTMDLVFVCHFFL